MHLQYVCTRVRVRRRREEFSCIALSVRQCLRFANALMTDGKSFRGREGRPAEQALPRCVGTLFVPSNRRDSDARESPDGARCGLRTDHRGSLERAACIEKHWNLRSETVLKNPLHPAALRGVRGTSGEGRVAVWQPFRERSSLSGR